DGGRGGAGRTRPRARTQLIYFVKASAGPYPPPPPDSQRSTSPAFTGRALTLSISRRSGRPGLSTTRGGAPGSPPARPQAGVTERSNQGDSEVAAATSSSRIAPAPPRQRPAPPLPSRMA